MSASTLVRFLLPRALFVALVIVLIDCGAAAGISDPFTIRLEATERGWISATGFENTNGNYIARETGRGDKIHNYFYFDLSSVDETITGARLELFNPIDGIEEGGGGIFSVYGGQFVDGNSFGALVDGPLWGSQAVSDADNGAFVFVLLNDDFLSAANAEGNTILLGGKISASHVFGNTSFDDNPASDTVLALSVVPEPTAFAMTFLALLALMSAVRRRPRS